MTCHISLYHRSRLPSRRFPREPPIYGEKNDTHNTYSRCSSYRAIASTDVDGIALVSMNTPYHILHISSLVESHRLREGAVDVCVCGVLGGRRAYVLIAVCFSNRIMSFSDCILFFG